MVLSNPKKTKAIASACIKNEQIETDKLLHLLRHAHLPEIWVPPAPLCCAKEVLRFRVLLVHMRTGLKTMRPRQRDGIPVSSNVLGAWSVPRFNLAVYSL